MIGSDYGNARLHARHARRLTSSDYSMLLSAGGLDQMLGSLATTSYAEDVEAAVARYRGIRRLDEACRTHLGRQYRDALSFYEGAVRDSLRLLAERWDIRNLVALLRAQTAPAGVTDLATWLVPAGRLDAAAIAELAAQPGVRATVDLAVSWRAPDSEVAKALRRALSSYEATGDTVVLEASLFRAFVGRVNEGFAARPDDAVLRLVRAEIAGEAITIALRARRARTQHESPIDPASLVVVPLLPRGVIEGVVTADDAAVVVSILGARPLPSGFDAALARWQADEDEGRLADDLVAAVSKLSGRLWRGDPLGTGVPAGFLWAKEQEARNLRLIGRAHVHGLDRELVEERLVIT